MKSQPLRTKSAHWIYSRFVDSRFVYTKHYKKLKCKNNRRTGSQRIVYTMYVGKADLLLRPNWDRVECKMCIEAVDVHARKSLHGLLKKSQLYTQETFYS